MKQNVVVAALQHLDRFSLWSAVSYDQCNSSCGQLSLQGLELTVLLMLVYYVRACMRQYAMIDLDSAKNGHNVFNST